MKTFVHSFEDASADGCLSFDSNAETPAKIEVSVEPNGNIWLAANREGFLHLARVFTELGLGAYEDGYHFHKSRRFDWSKDENEFSIELNNNL